MKVKSEFWSDCVTTPRSRLADRPLLRAVWTPIGACIAIVALAGLSAAALVCIAGPSQLATGPLAGTVLESLLPGILLVIALAVVGGVMRSAAAAFAGRRALSVDSVFVAVGAALAAFYLVIAFFLP